MKLKEKMEGDIAVISVTGNMMGGPESTELHDKVKSLINDGVKKVVIDLQGVKWMNSSGLGTLMACMSSMQQAKGQMKLASVTEKVQSILMITKLTDLFDTCDTVDHAVARFKDVTKKS